MRVCPDQSAIRIFDDPKSSIWKSVLDGSSYRPVYDTPVGPDPAQPEVAEPAPTEPEAN